MSAVTGTLTWIVIPYVSETAVGIREECHFPAANQSVVFLLARDQMRKPNGLRLQKVFGEYAVLELRS